MSAENSVAVSTCSVLAKVSVFACNAPITKDSVELMSYLINHFKLSYASFCPRQSSGLIPSLWIVRPQVPSILPYKLNIWATVKDLATFLQYIFHRNFCHDLFFTSAKDQSYSTARFFLYGRFLRKTIFFI